MTGYADPDKRGKPDQLLQAEKDCKFRRIFLRQEAEQIERLQHGVRVFEHYPRHAEWLKKAIHEISEGRRKAFGAFRAAFDEAGDVTDPILIGSIILKENRLTDTVELKNLFVAEDMRLRKYGTLLYRTVEQQCAKQGYRRVLTETPDEPGTICFLMKMGFQITDKQPSPYKDGETLYHLTKPLTPFYSGDCFDLQEIAAWVVNNHYPFDPVHQIADRVPQLVKLRASSWVPATGQTSTLAIRAAVAVIDTPDQAVIEAELDKLANTAAHFALAFVREPPHVDVRRWGYGIVVIGHDMLCKAFGHRFKYPPPSFPIDEVVGMIVAVNPHFHRQDEMAGTTFAYFKGGPNGKYLKQGHKAVIFREPVPGGPRGGITGICDIARVVQGQPAEVWEELKEDKHLFTYEEYMAWAAHKTSIIGMSLTGFTSLSLLDMRSLLRVIGVSTDWTDIGHRYLDSAMLDRLLEMPRTRRRNGNMVDVSTFMPLIVEVTRFVLDEVKTTLGGGDAGNKTKTTRVDNDVAFPVDDATLRKLIDSPADLAKYVDPLSADTKRYVIESTYKQVQAHIRNRADLQEKKAILGLAAPPDNNRLIEHETEQIQAKSIELRGLLAAVYRQEPGC